MKKQFLVIYLFCLCVLTGCLGKQDFTSILSGTETDLDSLYIAEAGRLINDSLYDEARILLQQAEKNENIRIKAAYYFQMTILEERLGNLEAAYANFVEYHNYTEAIFKEEHRALLRQEAKQARLHYSLIIVFSLIFVTSFFVFYKLHQKKTKQQNEIQCLLDQYKNGEIELNQLDELIESKKCYSIQLTFLPYLIQADLFKETSLYTEIQTLGRQTKNTDARVLNYNKQEQLRTELQKFFPTFVSDLNTRASKLTEKDIQLCCLSLLPINNFTKALCFGSTDTNIIKQRKFQIRKKMLDDSYCQLLFEFIFDKRSE